MSTLEMEQSKNAIAPSTENPNLVWSAREGNYILIIERMGGQFWPYILRNTELVWSSGVLPDFELARGCAIAKYYRLSNGLYDKLITEIDPDLLAFHPHNYHIYTKIDNSSLEKQIEESGKIYRVTSNLDGVLVAGNRRLECALAINARAIAKGLPRPFPKIEIEARGYVSHEEEIDDLIRRNQYRVKSREELEIECAIMLQAEKVKAEARMKAGIKVKDEEKGKPSDRVAAYAAEASGGEWKVSGPTMEDTLTAANYIKEQRERGNLDYAKQLEQVKARSVKAVHDVMQVAVDDTELAKKLAQRLSNGTNKSVEKVKAEILRERLIEESEKDDDENKLIIVRCIKEKANERDDYYTPPNIKKLIYEVLGNQVDCDPFADPLKKSINAKIHYNVLDNGFNKDWEGTVASNVPFSQAGIAMKAFDRNIRAGNISEAIILFPSGVIHNNGTQNCLKEHQMIFCAIKGRVSFIPGEILKKINPGHPNTEANVDVCVLYYGENKQKFADTFQELGLICYPNNAIADSNNSNIAPINWKETERGFLAHYGNKFEIVKDYNEGEIVWSVIIDNHTQEEVFGYLQTAQNFCLGYAIAQTMESESLSDFGENPFG